MNERFSSSPIQRILVISDDLECGLSQVMPKVSIVCASYNHEAYVGHLIESVLSQSYTNFELIIVDDCSSDRTVEIIRQYQDERLILMTSDRNRGQFVATNRGINAAKGEYIATINSDDAFLAGKLEKQVAFLDSHPEIGAVFTLPQIIDEQGREFVDRKNRNTTIFNQPNRSQAEWLRYFFDHGNCLCHPSCMIRKHWHDQIGLYEHRFANMADLDLWVRLCLKTTLHIIPEQLTQFRVHARSGSRKSQVTKKRSRWEHTQLMRHFLTIDSISLLLQMFPELASLEAIHSEPDAALTPYFLALMSLSKNRPLYDLFALDALFEVMADESRMERLADRYQFTTIDFFRLTGERDPYNLLSNEKLKDLKRHLLKPFQPKTLSSPSP